MSNEVDVKKKEVESFENLFRRFGKRVQESGLLIRARKIRFFEPEKNKRAVKESALRRKEIREHKEFLRKTGRLVK